MTRKVFIDCGANLGQSVMAFYSIFNNPEEFEIHSFEPSKLLKNSLVHNLKRFNNVSIHHKAAWIDNGGVLFDDQGNESSSTEIDKYSTRKSRMLPFPSIDLSEFIKSYSEEDYVILKVDIEGGEYKLFEHLESTGALRFIDEVYLELHAAKMHNTKIEQDFHLIDNLSKYGLQPRSWAAEKHLEKKVIGNVIDREWVIYEWKRKRRL